VAELLVARIGGVCSKIWTYLLIYIIFLIWIILHWRLPATTKNQLGKLELKLSTETIQLANITGYEIGQKEVDFA
jgi:hypothetical protein